MASPPWASFRAAAKVALASGEPSARAKAAPPPISNDGDNANTNIKGGTLLRITSPPSRDRRIDRGSVKADTRPLGRAQPDSPDTGSKDG